MNKKENKLFLKIKNQVGKSISDFNLIESGDRIAVGMSGGKDSYTLLYILNELKKRAPIDFELVAVNIHNGFNGYRTEVIENYLKKNNFAVHMKKSNYYNIIEKKKNPKTSYCAFCSRFRRGVFIQSLVN